MNGSTSISTEAPKSGRTEFRPGVARKDIVLPAITAELKPSTDKRPTTSPAEERKQRFEAAARLLQARG